MAEPKENPTCDDCKERGRCCKEFKLSDSDAPPWAFTTKDSKKTVENRLKKAHLPFVPARKHKHYWWFSCPKIGSDGKCTIYPERPKVCRDFKVGGNVLCYHYKDDKGESYDGK